MPEAATAPPPAVTQPGNPGPNLSEAFSSFDALVAAPKPEPKTDTAPVDDTKPIPETKLAPETKPAPETTPQNPDPKIQTPTKVKAATLRDELDRTRTEAADWKGKYEKLVAEAKTPKPDPEKDELLKSRDDWNKRRDELENELKFSNYERSTEYKERYQQPFLNAYEQGGKLITALTLTEADKKDEYGAVLEPGTSRKGTQADWDSLMAITDEDAANKFISDHFGHNAARVTLMRDKVLDLHGQMRTAVEEFRKTAGTRETQLKEQLTQQQKQVSEYFHKANQHAAEKYPQYFAPDPADAKGNELLAQGTRLTDLAFGVLDTSEFSKLPKQIQDKLVNGQLSLTEKTLLHSAIRNRSAAYDRLVFRLNQKDTELKTLQEKLAGFEQSEPSRGQPRKVEQQTKKGVPGTLAEVDSMFDQIAAQNG